MTRQSAPSRCSASQSTCAARAAELSVAQRHMTQIAAAVRERARVLVLDEPTSALTAKETDWLFEQIARFKSAGVGIIYISHRQEEIFRLADRITVLRDGRAVWTGPRQAIDRAELLRTWWAASATAEPTARAERARQSAPSERLRGQRLHRQRRPLLRRVAVGSRRRNRRHLRTGRLGPQRIAQAIFALEPTPAAQSPSTDESNRSTVPPPRLPPDSPICPRTACDRRAPRSIGPRQPGAQRVEPSRSRSAGQRPARASGDRGQIEALAIKCRSTEQPIGQLSGGNQQKVVLGRWLLDCPKVLLLDEPTRGVDVGAKAEIHRILRRLADDGAAVVLISSDLPEVMENSDRIIVFRAGRMAGEFAPGTHRPSKSPPPRFPTNRSSKLALRTTSAAACRAPCAAS